MAYANIGAAGWTVAVDRSRSSLFASARRALVLEWTLIGAVSLLVIGVAALFFLRARREADRSRVRELLRSELARTLGATTAVSEVADAVASALGSAFPGGARRDRLHGGRRRAAAGVGVLGRPAPRGGWPRTRHVVARVGRRRRPGGAGGRGRDPLGDPPAAARASRAPLGRSTCCRWSPDAAGAAACSCSCSAPTHGLDADEQSLIASHAEQAARALERAQVQEREHAVAVTLQRGLLAESLPEIDSLDLAARYEAGSAGLEVGGDWYDVVVRPDGMVLAIVGDVAGRGITAATLMGRLRSAFRAYAYDFASPAEVLRRLVRHVPATRWPRRSCWRSTRTRGR